MDKEEFVKRMLWQQRITKIKKNKEKEREYSAHISCVISEARERKRSTYKIRKSGSAH